MMYAYLIKARPKAGKPNLFTWFDCKSDSRADREVMNILEDGDIETGRGADYQLPVRTDVPVFNDLPEERALDAAWCDRYELGENGKTWQKNVAAEETKETVKAPSREQASERLDEMRNLEEGDIIDSSTLPFNYEIAHYWLGGMYTATPKERKAAIAAAMDTDNSHLQNVLLALNSVEPCKHCFNHIRQSLVESIQSIWPVEGKTPELNLVLTFTQEWMGAVNDNSETEGVKRKPVTEKWLTRYRKERTPSGATAGGLNKTDRNPNMIHTLDTLDIEIACALLPFDFDIYNFEQAILRRAKEMVVAKESPWKEWSRKLRNCPGILDYSRAAIFALIRNAAPNIHMMPGTHQAWINAKLTETNHANPGAETLAMAKHLPASDSTSEPSVDAGSELVNAETVSTSEQPEVKRISATVFSIEGLIGAQEIDNPVINTPSVEVAKEEINPLESAHEQMEKTGNNEVASGDEISEGEGTHANDPQAAAIDEPEITEAEEESSAQQIQNLTQRIERLESALAALGSVFTSGEVA